MLLAGVAAGAAVLFFSLPSAAGGPVVEEPTVLTETRSYEDMRVTMDPVPDAYEPKIAAESALDMAKEMHADFDTAARVAPVLALYTNDQVVVVKTGEKLVQSIPAWVVDIEGLCAEVYGGFGSGMSGETGCVPQTRHVVVNAETGDLIEDWGE